MENTIELKTTIKASAEKVWDTITNPDKIEQYMFGSRVDTDWKPGSKSHFFIEQDNKQITIVKGEVIRNIPGKLLEHTLFPNDNKLNDTLENYIVITYQLEEHGDETDLTITQRGFKYVEDGLQRYIDTQKGWKIALPKLKEVAES
ncbi:MAG: SRPBCC domain-containing protein [bacterium]|jgi:uncharacterized protein YndB with AHSA1/START domain|nr:SRPBCC domain-containing protein [bacterium]